jgi:hypothetical protein
MNNDSFAGLEAWENMPMRKWLELLKVHNSIIERRNEAMKQK